MTLKEALESGKPYTIDGKYPWLDPENKEVFFAIEDVLSTEWKIKTAPREWQVYVVDDGSGISSHMLQGAIWKHKPIRVREVL